MRGMCCRSHLLEGFWAVEIGRSRTLLTGVPACRGLRVASRTPLSSCLLRRFVPAARPLAREPCMQTDPCRRPPREDRDASTAKFNCEHPGPVCMMYLVLYDKACVSVPSRLTATLVPSSPILLLLDSLRCDTSFLPCITRKQLSRVSGQGLSRPGRGFSFRPPVALPWIGKLARRRFKPLD